MQKLLVVLVILVIAAGGVAYWRGWFTVDKGGVHVNKEKFAKDKEAAKKKTSETGQKFQAKIDSLRKKSDSGSDEEKKKAKEEIEKLTKEKADLEAKLKEVEDEKDEEKAMQKLEELNKHIDDSGDPGK